MELSWLIVLTLITLVLSGLFSGSEIAFVQSSKVRMEIDAARGGLVDKIIRTFSRHGEMFLSTMLLGNNIVLVVYGITFSMILDKAFEPVIGNRAVLIVINTLISTGVVLIAGEYLPKSAFRINPNFMIRLFSIPLFLVYWILYPISLLAAGISKGMMKLFGLRDERNISEGLTIDELDDYLQNQIDSIEVKEEVENEVKIFRNAIDFKDTQMGECMIPRNEIIAVDINDINREELLKKFTATGLSKIVVYGEDIDDVLGYIHISELFDVEADWKKGIKPVIFTPETMLANKLMRRMLSEKRSMAIIVDEFGGTAGLATLEDLVEEIFGEIEDEHDRNRQLAKEVSPGIYEISGRAEIGNINEEFAMNIPEEEDYQTLGGFILDRMGVLPQVDDSFEFEGLRFTVLKMSATKIELVRIEKI